MKCNNCGGEITQGDVYCKLCGISQIKDNSNKQVNKIKYYYLCVILIFFVMFFSYREFRINQSYRIDLDIWKYQDSIYRQCKANLPQGTPWYPTCDSPGPKPSLDDYR